MMQFLSIISGSLVVCTGFSVLIMGEWGKFGIKFAAVVLSTLAAIWLMIFTFTFGTGFVCHGLSSSCTTYGIYHVLRNAAFILFHIAIGRDAIRFKKHDRRGMRPWPKST